MSDNSSGSERAARKWLLWGALFFLVVAFGPRALNVYVDALWFQSLDYSPVFWYSFWLRLGLFFGFFALTVLILRGAFVLLERAFAGYKLGNAIIQIDGNPVEFEPEKFMRPIGWGIAVVWAFLYSTGFSSNWDSFALFFNRVAAGEADPIFNLDNGFYLFAWPVLRFIVSWLLSMAVIIFLAACAYAFFAFTMRAAASVQARARRVSYVAASLALAAVLLSYAARTFLDRFSYLWRDHELLTGVTYTQAHVTLPGLMLLIVVLVLAAAVAVANAFLWRRLRVVLGAIAVPVVVYFGLGLVSSYVQNLTVKPNELERETPYIRHNIAATRAAFGLANAQEGFFPAKRSIDALNLEENQSTLNEIRLWDWRPLQDTLQQLQGIRNYYAFPDVDVDRYRLNGRLRQVMVAARELDLNLLPTASRNWVNLRLIYTHGYGVTMNTASGFTPEGRPVFLLSEMPVRAEENIDLRVTRPQIYFGHLTNTPVYVMTRQREFDYPREALRTAPPRGTDSTASGSAAADATDEETASEIEDREATEDNAYTTYDGEGGIEMGGFFRRLLLAWKVGDLTKVPFSDDITPQSRLLIYRNIRQRVEKVAPFLSLDGDPYIVVGADGRLSWIMDAYTSSVYYPYSRHYRTAGSQEWTNYMRNSVKVVVDAYDGTIDFYVFAPDDPIIRAYRKAFPTLFKDRSEMPSDLQEHVRYPERLFRTQGSVYSLYHTTNVRVFFQREDVRVVPVQEVRGREAVQTGPMPPGMVSPAGVAPPSSSGDERLEPYFVLMHLPGIQSAGEEFVQIQPFAPLNRKNMISWMAGRSDGENYGQLYTYNFPKSEQVEGPEQIQGRINQNNDISRLVTLWSSNKSEVVYGNLLVIPIGEGILFVQPIFLQSESIRMPELRLVVLGTQSSIGFGPNFRAALTNLMRQEAVQGESVPADDDDGAASDPIPASVSADGDADNDGAAVRATPIPTAEQQELINRAADDLEAYQRLMSEGKFTEAGQRLESLQQNLRQLRR